LSAYEIDIAINDGVPSRVPRRCHDRDEAVRVASQIFLMYADKSEVERIAIQFRRVE